MLPLLADDRSSPPPVEQSLDEAPISKDREDVLLKETIDGQKIIQSSKHKVLIYWWLAAISWNIYFGYGHYHSMVAGPPPPSCQSSPPLNDSN